MIAAGDLACRRIADSQLRDSAGLPLLYQDRSPASPFGPTIRGDGHCDHSYEETIDAIERSVKRHTRVV